MIRKLRNLAGIAAAVLRRRSLLVTRNRVFGPP